MQSTQFDEDTFKKCVLVCNLPSGENAETFCQFLVDHHKLQVAGWLVVDDSAIVFRFDDEKSAHLARVMPRKYKKRWLEVEPLTQKDTPIIPNMSMGLIKQGEVPSDEHSESDSSDKPAPVEDEKAGLVSGPVPTWTRFDLQDSKALELVVPYFRLEDALNLAQAFPEVKNEVRNLFVQAQGFQPYMGAPYRSAAASSGVYGTFLQPWGAQLTPTVDSVIGEENQFLSKLFNLGTLTSQPTRALSLAKSQEVEEEEEVEPEIEEVKPEKPVLEDKYVHEFKQYKNDEEVFDALLMDKHDGEVATKYGTGSLTNEDNRATSVELNFGTVWAPKKKIHPQKTFKDVLADKLKKYKATFHKKWGSGVGYGSSYTNDTKGWSVKSWLKNEKERQKQIQTLLSELRAILKVGGDKQKMDWIVDSSFLPSLVHWLNNDSIQDMGSRYTLYKEVLKTVGKIIAIPELLPLVFEKHGGTFIAQAISRLYPAAKMVTQFGDEDAKDMEDVNGKLAIRITDVYQQLLDQIDRMMRLVDMMKAISGDTSEEQNSLIPGLTSLKEQIENGFKVKMDNASAEDYEAIMREMCFDSVENMSSFPGHKYAGLKSNPRRKVLKRLAAEYSDFDTCLPIHEASSVFFRFCDESMCHAQMLIVAVDDTPYATGCFIFDVKFPDNYPAAPPKVNLQTTGRGAVRFNPNLYNCGKVCLSLLGTWSGRNEGERWIPGLSTFLQVAISIQSLIFVPEPYFNEPGWERYMGTADGDRRSKQYNVVIEKGTTQYAIIEMIENPPAQWKDVIHTHFRMQSARVMKNVTKWHGKDHELTKKVQSLLEGLQEKKAESPLVAPALEKKTSDGA
jgi:baculoviral IAP repeat-containing protein 6